MEGLVQTQQELLEEVFALRAKVVELEKAETEQRQWFLCEQALRHTLTQIVEQQRQSISTSQVQVKQLEATIETLWTNAQTLDEAKQSMDVRLSIANHELRNSLTIIHGNIQLAKRRLKYILPDQDRAAETQEDILDKVQEVLSRAEEQVRIQDGMLDDLLVCTGRMPQSK